MVAEARPASTISSAMSWAIHTVSRKYDAVYHGFVLTCVSRADDNTTLRLPAGAVDIIYRVHDYSLEIILKGIERLSLHRLP